MESIFGLLPRIKKTQWNQFWIHHFEKWKSLKTVWYLYWHKWIQCLPTLSDSTHVKHQCKTRCIQSTNQWKSIKFFFFWVKDKILGYQSFNGNCINWRIWFQCTFHYKTVSTVTGAILMLVQNSINSTN